MSESGAGRRCKVCSLACYIPLYETSVRPCWQYLGIRVIILQDTSNLPPHCYRLSMHASRVHMHARLWGLVPPSLQTEDGMTLRQQTSCAGVGATGVQVPGHQDKGRNTGKVWMVIVGFRRAVCLMDSRWSEKKKVSRPMLIGNTLLKSTVLSNNMPNFDTQTT